jgi:hypothetical protein
MSENDNTMGGTSSSDVPDKVIEELVSFKSNIERLHLKGDTSTAFLLHNKFKEIYEKLGNQIGFDLLRERFEAERERQQEARKGRLRQIPLAVVHQKPVGHGGFHVGALGLDEPAFRWIYDCGAWREAGKAALAGEIADYTRAVVGSRRPVDLLFVSHFDADHVSGLNDLLGGLKRVGVRTVVIPYLNSDEAFAVIAGAAAADRWSPEVGRVVFDPVSWFVARGVKRVIRIRPDDGGGPPPVLDGGPRLEGGTEPAAPDGDLAAVFQDRHGRLLGAGLEADAQDIVTDTGLRVWVGAGSSYSDWCFIPYVHPAPPEELESLRAEAQGLFGCSPDDANFPEVAITFMRSSARRKELREIIERKELGDANAISMSLYIGPSTRSGERLIYSKNAEVPLDKAGWLLTGDAQLANRTRRSRWLSFFEATRDQIGVMMLPHHGAAGNFHREILQAAPAATFFITADENDRRRPHKNVEDDIKEHDSSRGYRRVSESKENGIRTCSGPSWAQPDADELVRLAKSWT